MGISREGGDGGHDNSELEEALRNFEMLSKQFHDFSKIRNKAEVVVLDSLSQDFVAIGCEVTFIDQYDKVQTVSIGSYIPSDASTAISYNAPIARILIGLEVGDSCEGVIVGNHVEFTVLSITSVVQP